MQNRKFERAANNRRAIAIFFALAFHLGLLAYIIFNQQTSNYLNGLFAGEDVEQVEKP